MADQKQTQDREARQRQGNPPAPPRIDAVDEGDAPHDSPPGEMQDEPAIKDRDRDGARDRPSSGKSDQHFKGDQA